MGDSAGRINGVVSRHAAALIFRLLLRVSVYAPLRARILGPRLSHTTSSRLAVSACSMAQPGVSRHIKPRKACRGWWVILSVAALSMDVAAQEAALPGKFYRIVDGKVDPRTYNGYRLSRGLQPLPRAGRHGLIVWPFACGPPPRYLKPSGVSCTTAKAVERRS